MIPHLVGIIAMVLVSRSSDRRLERRYHAAIPVMVGGVALLLMGIFHSPFFLVTLLSVLAAGVYSFPGPFWALPGEFLTGFSAAAGIGLINSVANLGGFVGPYSIGVISGWTGGIYRGLALAGIPLLFSAMLLLLLPKKPRSQSSAGKRSAILNNRAAAASSAGATGMKTSSAQGYADCRIVAPPRIANRDRKEIA